MPCPFSAGHDQAGEDLPRVLHCAATIMVDGCTGCPLGLDLEDALAGCPSVASMVDE